MSESSDFIDDADESHSESPPAIFGLLAAASAKVGAIPKDSRNVQQGFNFRGIDSILAHVQPVFAELGIVVTPRVLEVDTTMLPVGREGQTRMWRLVQVTMRFRFHGPEGDYVDAVTIGEGFDPGDKAGNKAMTGAFKYALTQVLCLAAGALDDSDGESYEAASAPPQRRSEPVRPLHGDEIDELIRTMNDLPLDQRGVVKAQFLAHFDVIHPYELASVLIPDAREWVRTVTSV